MYFEDGDGASLLAHVFPDENWETIGGVITLSYSAFASLMLEAGMVLSPAGYSASAVFGGYMLDIAPLNKAWAEDRRLAPADFWYKQERGAFVRQLRELRAGRNARPAEYFIDLSAEDVLIQVQPLLPPPMDDDAAGTAARELREKVLKATRWTRSVFYGRGGVGSAAVAGMDGDTRTLGQLLHYTGGLFTPASREAGSAFYLTADLIFRAASPSADKSAFGPATLDDMSAAGAAAQAITVFAQAEWPAPIYLNALSPSARELDLLHRMQYAEVGGVGPTAERILTPRLMAAVAALPALGLVLRGVASPVDARAQLLLLFEAFGISEPHMLHVKSMEALNELLKGQLSLLGSAEFQSVGLSDRLVKVRALGVAHKRAGAGGSVERPESGHSDAEKKVGGAGRLSAMSMSRALILQGRADYVATKRVVLDYIRTGDALSAIEGASSHGGRRRQARWMGWHAGWFCNPPAYRQLSPLHIHASAARAPPHHL